MGSEQNPANLVEVAGGEGSALSGEEPLHPDRRRRQAVEGSILHGRCKEAFAGIREFFKVKVHFRSYVWCSRRTHRSQRRKVLCPFADGHPGRPAYCIILGWFRDFPGQPRCADGPQRLCSIKGSWNGISAVGQILSFRNGAEGTEST